MLHIMRMTLQHTIRQLLFTQGEKNPPQPVLNKHSDLNCLCGNINTHQSQFYGFELIMFTLIRPVSNVAL